MSDNFIIEWMDGKAGFINDSGNWVVSPIYDDIRYFSNGLALVNFYKGYENHVGYIDKSSNLVIGAVYSNGSDFSGIGLAAVQSRDNGLWGYIDKNGDTIIPFQFTRAYDFSSNGLAKVTFPNRQGVFFIDSNANTVFSTSYQFYEDNPHNDSFKRGFAEDYTIIPVSNSNNMYGFINEMGELVIPFEYEFADKFSDGLALVKKHNKYGFINEDGDIVIDFRYEYALNFKHGYAVVEKEGKYTYVNTDGELMNCFFTIASSFGHHGLARVLDGSEAAYISCVSGEIELVVPAHINPSQFSDNGLASFEVNGKFGFLNLSGDTVIAPEYTRASNFRRGLALVTKKSFFSENSLYINKNNSKIKDFKSSGLLDHMRFIDY